MTKLPSTHLFPLVLLPLSLAACSESFTATGGAGGTTSSTSTSTSMGGAGGTTSPGGSGGATGGATTGGTGGTGGTVGCAKPGDCGLHESCVANVCVCSTGFADCGSGCIDTQSDAANCGACGTKCGNKCVTGTCDDPVDVAAGGATTCAVLALGDVYCWGRNNVGQFGSGMGSNSGSPVKVAGLPPMKRVFLGKNVDNGHVCGISKADELYCWGSNQSGKLGINSMDNGPQPVAKVSGISGIVSVGLGGMHSVALEGTKVIGWGANDAAQLGYMGNGSPAPNSQSAQNGEAISAGGAHTCAVSSSALRCWGRNQEGQLGIGFAGGPALPTLVDLNDQPVADVACGEGHTCIRMDGGDVLCWGFNVEGQLGNGGIVSSSAAGEPVQIGGSATSIAAGNAHTGAISNNDLYLWGRNTQGEILSNQLALIVSTPTKIGNLHNVRKAALGSQHSCVLDKSGNPVHVVCWGGNSDGQVGNGAIGGDHKAAAEVAFP